MKSVAQCVLVVSMVFSLSACIFCNKQPKVATPPPPPPKEEVAQPAPPPPAPKEEIAQPAPEPAKAVEAPKPAPVMEKESMTLLVEFDTNKAKIKPKYDSELARVADFMKKYPTATTTIEGHTDNVGSMKSNMRTFPDTIRPDFHEKFEQGVRTVKSGEKLPLNLRKD